MSTSVTQSAYRFHPAGMARPWGGTRLGPLLGLPQAAEPIGEAWLISDHPQHESVVAEGPDAGLTLRALLARDSKGVLGARPALTIHGRFPLLLKLLDAAEPLSVQVHPDDAAAVEMNEPDVGKTEMWHVLEAAPDSVIYYGMAAEDLEAVARGEEPERRLAQFHVPPGASVLVPAGTVHAIGPGLLLAEIQQNSDLTYRIYDWGRTDVEGKPRALHLDKARRAMAARGAGGGPTTPLHRAADPHTREVLCACPYFAAERLHVAGKLQCRTGGSFHLLLGIDGAIEIATGNLRFPMWPGAALLVTGGCAEFGVSGVGTLLDYYVPNLERDIVAPLCAAGHSEAEIARLGVPVPGCSG